MWVSFSLQLCVKALRHDLSSSRVLILVLRIQIVVGSFRSSERGFLVLMLASIRTRIMKLDFPWLRLHPLHYFACLTWPESRRALLAEAWHAQTGTPSAGHVTSRISRV